MKQYTLFAILLFGATLFLSSCKDDDCTEETWYQDADGDGLGNPAVTLDACEEPTGYVCNAGDTDDTGGSDDPTDDPGDDPVDDPIDDPVDPSCNPVAAYDEFNSSSVTISFDGDDVTIESTALPNHTSPYWDPSEDLYIDPVVADANQMSPGIINEGSYTVTVPACPEVAANTTATGLGAIGISVTGVPIFNDQEGPNIQLSAAVASGFDYAGGHNGPTGYHYHLESANVPENTVLSHDDDALNGILQDGFLLYGRKCHSTGDYPTDLDASGGHISTTQHSDEAEFYHYHIINEIYTGTYIVLFGVDLAGTPNAIM